MFEQIKTILFDKPGFLIFLFLPLLVHGQISERHVMKVSRYMEKFNCYSDTLIDSMEIGDWKDTEVLSGLTDLTHEAYLHSLYISGMLDILIRIQDKNERASAVYRTAFYIKGAILFMRIASKALVTKLNLTENPIVISLGMKLKRETERFTAELETVKNELDYDYSYNMDTSKN
jgi:hypothetical protein